MGKDVDPSGAAATGVQLGAGLGKEIEDFNCAVLSVQLIITPPEPSDAIVRLNAGTSTGMIASNSSPIVMSELIRLPCFNKTAIALSPE